jgi:hypothetical protein
MLRLVDVPTRTSPSTLYGEVHFIIRNQADDIVLIPSICHIPKGEKDGDSSSKILPMSEASVKVKASLSSVGNIKCCMVYELVDQRNESEPIMEDHQVFIAVRVFARPFTSNYTVSAAMFSAKRGRFAGKEDDIKRLRENILRKHLVNNEYSFECTIKDQTLRLEAVFQPGKQASIVVTLKEAINYTVKRPVLFV